MTNFTCVATYRLLTFSMLSLRLIVLVEGYSIPMMHHRLIDFTKSCSHSRAMTLLAATTTITKATAFLGRHCTRINSGLPEQHHLSGSVQSLQPNHPPYLTAQIKPGPSPGISCPNRLVQRFYHTKFPFRRRQVPSAQSTQLASFRSQKARPFSRSSLSPPSPSESYSLTHPRPPTPAFSTSRPTKCGLLTITTVLRNPILSGGSPVFPTTCN